MNDSAPVNVALVGYGFAGKTLHAPLIAAVPGLRLAVVLSSNSEKVKRDLPDVAVASAADEVFSDPGVDLVVIATPNDSHFDLAGRALAAGKHLIVDKPLTTTVAEAVELERLARTAGRLLSVYHCRRWDADFLTVRQLIASGDLGRLVCFESRYDRYRPVVHARWRELPGPGSGIWFDLGSHLVDQVLQLFGMPEAVYADLGMQRESARAVDYFHVLLRYGSLRVILHGSNLVAEPARRFEVHGTRASFVKFGMDTQEPALRRGEQPGGPGWGADLMDGTLTVSEGDAPEIRSVRSIPGDYRAYYEAIRGAIRCGAPNPVTAAEAVAVMKVLELACRSAAERRELAFTRTPSAP
jgi:predicted dehydrogenase